MKKLVGIAAQHMRNDVRLRANLAQLFFAVTVMSLSACGNKTASGPSAEIESVREVLVALRAKATDGNWASMAPHFAPTPWKDRAQMAVTRPGVYDFTSFWLPEIETDPDSWHLSRIAHDSVNVVAQYRATVRLGEGDMFWAATVVRLDGRWTVVCEGYADSERNAKCWPDAYGIPTHAQSNSVK